MRTTGKATDLITFSRSSGGTYLDSDGVLKTASADIPRIEYDANGNVLGLLVEESRTNLVTYSNDLSSTGENFTELTTSSPTDFFRYYEANATVSPTGEVNAAKLVESTNDDQQRIYAVYSLTSGETYCWSGFFKAAGRDYVILRTTATSPTSFNLLTGAVTADPYGTAAIEDYGNGWFRCSVIFTAPSTTQVPWIALSNDGIDDIYVGDGTSGIYIYGAQLEAGAFPTSYIPTSGSTATRAADVASIATSEFGYRDDEGTVVVEADASVIGTNRLYSLHHDAATNDAIYGYAGLNGHLIIRSNAVTEAAIDAGDMAVGVMSKVAGAFKLNSVAASMDGGAVVTDTSAAMPAVTATVLTIGGRYLTPPSNLNGHIKSIKYIPRRLTNDQLQEITS